MVVYIRRIQSPIVPHMHYGYTLNLCFTRNSNSNAPLGDEKCKFNPVMHGAMKNYIEGIIYKAIDTVAWDSKEQPHDVLSTCLPRRVFFRRYSLTIDVMFRAIMYARKNTFKDFKR